MTTSRPEHNPITPEPASSAELEAVRQRELQQTVDSRRPNIFIGTLNIIAGPMRAFTDPVKKICYPRLEAHWEEKYKQRFPKHAKKLLIFDLVLLFLVSALAVALILVHTALPDIYFAELISISLQQPTTITSGSETDLVFSYVSGSKLAVRDAKIIIETTADFILNEDNPNNLNFNPDPDRPNRRIYQLGDLLPAASGLIHLTGIAYGSPGQSLPVLAQLSYWESGKAERTSISSFQQIPIEISPLKLEINFEKPFLLETVNQIKINYENQSAQTLSNIAVQLSTPSDFYITGTLPARTNNHEWLLGDLKPNATGVITVYGIMKRGTPPSFSLTGSTVIDHEKYLLNKIRVNADTVSTGFVLSHDVSEITSLSPGQEIEVRVHYANNGEQIIKNVKITLSAEGTYLSAGENLSIVWNKNTDAALAVIQPGEAGMLATKLALALERTSDELKGNNNPSVKITAVAEYSLEQTSARVFRTDSGISNLPIDTLIKIDTATLYHAPFGDQLGLGPIPPRTEKTTRLWIALSVKNGHNPVRNARLTATLMPKILWLDKTSVTLGHPLAYVASERKLIWEIGDLPAFAGDFLPAATANFEIELTPTLDDIGQILKLIDYIKVEGEDVFTGTRVRAEGEAATSAVKIGTEEARLGKILE
jgi:hypothetical protein